MTEKGTCEKHGEFDLREGCPQCITEASIKESVEAVQTYKVPDLSSMTTKEEANKVASEMLEQTARQAEEPVTALATLPGSDELAVTYYNEALRLQEYAESRVIATVEDDKLANDDLIIIGKLRKAMEAKKREYLDPLRRQAEAIRDTYSTLMDPVERADKITRDKMGVFKLEQERKAREAEDLNRQAMEVARKQAAMNNGEFTTDITPVDIPPAPKLTRSALGTSGLVANWKYRVIDLEKLPREYMIPDDAMLKSIAKQHHDQKLVPGVEFYNDPHIASRAK